MKHRTLPTVHVLSGCLSFFFSFSAVVSHLAFYRLRLHRLAVVSILACSGAGFSKPNEVAFTVRLPHVFFCGWSERVFQICTCGKSRPVILTHKFWPQQRLPPEGAPHGTQSATSVLADRARPMMCVLIGRVFSTGFEGPVNSNGVTSTASLIIML